MLLTLGLLSVFSATPADIPLGSDVLGSLPALHVHAEGRPSSHIAGRLALRSPLLEMSDRLGRRSHTSVVRAQEAPAETPAGDNASSSPAPADEQEPDIEMLRHREHLVRMHRPLGFATLASLFITEVAGTILAINQQTLFGPGNCNTMTTDGSNPCLLGDFGSGRGPLNAFHEVSAFITVGFYAATGMYGLTMPDPEHASQGNDARAQRLRVHKALAYVHLAGMILLPILGVLSVEPGLVGLTYDPMNPGSRNTITDYQATMRTIHLGVGYVTFAALTTAMLYETVF